MLRCLHGLTLALAAALLASCNPQTGARVKASDYDAFFLWPHGLQMRARVDGMGDACDEGQCGCEGVTAVLDHGCLLDGFR